uniref:Uncharacterized protein n=1 Tax=Plectus sambesii TaxID=2011161 RepID=A0A914UJE6_9BILA
LLNKTFEPATAAYKKKLLVIAANETAAMGVKLTVINAKNTIRFPDYDLQFSSGLYPFRFAERRTSWGQLNDSITFSAGAFAQAYNDKKQIITVVAQIHNHLGDHSRAFLDDRVELSQPAQLFVNSRILSLTIQPPPTKVNALETFPIWVLFEHFEEQPDRPYEKGALLCVTWNYNEINSSLLGGWDTDGCTLVSTNDTHSTCACTRFGAHALLAEQHEPKGRMSESAYKITHYLYAASILLLLFFMLLVVIENTLHYEIHIIHANAALAMVIALLSYVASWEANKDRIGCVFVSIVMHYSFTAAYLWCAISAHYLFRAITAGKLGSRIFIKYCILGWGLPALIVVIFAAIDVSKYGLGERCLGAHKDFFLWIYIGVFVALCFIVMPLCGIGFCNLPTMPIRDKEDRTDIRWSLIGTTLFWPVIMAVWVMAMFVYLIPQEYQLFDFLFELCNSVQGIAMFILFGLMVPPFRDTILCCTTKRKHNPDRVQFRINMYLEYYK